MNQVVAPLFGHPHADSIVAYRGARPITAHEFLADISRLSSELPAARYVLNACADRYRFAVGLCACLVADKFSLLQPTQTPSVLRHLRAFADDVVCLTDTDPTNVEMPVVSFPRTPTPIEVPWAVPMIRGDQPAAYVFTSGSTGAPVPHLKTWGRLLDCVTIEMRRLGLDGGTPCALLATVPPQHMYGFETSVLLPLRGGFAFAAERPFYPADIASALALLPRPRVLVTTPLHLRALLSAGLDLPVADLVVSATAPLDVALASEAEARFGCSLLEIYGSTETGQIASRRTVTTEQWQPWPGIELSEKGGGTWVRGGHVESEMQLADMLELLPGGGFLLKGRTADLVNIAGKRTSLGYLNHHLHAIPGVVDGAFFQPDESSAGPANGVGRVGAVVVAPGLTADSILRQLRQRLDPVFIPRPLLLVDELPRNSTGKLPRSVLKALGVGT